MIHTPFLVRSATVLLVSALMVGCSEDPPDSSGAEARISDSDSAAVRETIVRWFVAQGFGRGGPEVSTYYVRFDDSFSPADSFWRRFAGDAFRVRPAIGPVAPFALEGVTDPETGAAAIRVTISEVSSESATRVVVEASYDLRYLNGGYYRLILRKDDDRWDVAASVMLGQS